MVAPPQPDPAALNHPAPNHPVPTVTVPTAGPNRRTVVVGATLTVGAGIALAGCGSGSPPPAGAGTVLGPTSDVPVGSAKIFDAQGVVVTQATAGTFAGFSTVCPHQGCQVASVEGATIVCPCHGSEFGLDGQVKKGPAQRGLTAAAVRVTGTTVTIA